MYIWRNYKNPVNAGGWASVPVNRGVAQTQGMISGKPVVEMRLLIMVRPAYLGFECLSIGSSDRLLTHLVKQDWQYGKIRVITKEFLPHR